MSEYEARFTALSYFALNLVSTEKNKSKMSKDGLSLEVGSQVAPLTLRNFSDLIDVALTVKRDVKIGKQSETDKRSRTEFTQMERNFGSAFEEKRKWSSSFQSKKVNQSRGFPFGQNVNVSKQ
ncbi:hypothetical protein U1Q18_033496 [Sarracenia purpurea var. burkii]